MMSHGRRRSAASTPPPSAGDPRDDQNDEQARQRDAWITVQRAHAVANGLPVLVCNRIGHEADPSGHSTGIQFWGSSFVAGPQGEILAEADYCNRPRSCMRPSIWAAPRMCDASGRSCATAASMPIRI
jgi:hypothetical protein